MGQWVTGASKDIEIIRYFNILFTSDNGPRDFTMLGKVERKVTEEMNTQLGGTKSPSPDIMPLLFYQHYCKIVRPSVTSAIL